ncbi:MAG: Fe3+-siderophore ABC transporter permease [Candidatus Methanoprimaticola hominis]|nr:MAG: Fe3+-siderophore ABC transporter permease [Methanomassiliicoccales archaeon Mx-06]
MSPEGFDGDEMAENYRIYTLKKILFIVICIIAVVAVIGYAATIGSSNISAADVYRDIWYHFVDPSRCDPTIDWAVFDIRLPRIIGGLIVGSCLGVAGAAMQSMMKNPLADPYTTGISSGASFGATLAIGLGITVTGSAGSLGLILTAFFFSLIPAAVIIMVSSLRNTSAATMILAGIAVMYLFNACTTLIKLGISDESLSAVFQWSVGDLSQVTWSNCAVMCLFTVAGTAVLMAMSKKLNILITGDKNATALGLNAHRLRIVLLIIISLMAASVVCFTGIIGFIGLVAPHIVRIFLGSDNRYLIPASAAFGAVLLMVADLISRVVIAPTFLPVGVITAFIGCPMFLYLLIKQRRSMW